MTVTVDTNKTGLAGQVFTTTWANRPSSAPSTHLYYFTDVGAYGSFFQYAGSRWRVVNGVGRLKEIGNATGNIANSETISIQTLIPAGAWQTNDVVRVWLAGNKSGTTDVFSLTIRIGTAGTTGDTAITGLSAFQFLGTTARAGGGIYDIKLVSATSAMKVGGNSNGNGSYIGGTAAAVAATTITDASANALYVSVGVASSGATDTIVLQTGSIELITP